MTSEKKVELREKRVVLFLYYAQLNLSVYRKAVVNLWNNSYWNMAFLEQQKQNMLLTNGWTIIFNIK